MRALIFFVVLLAQHAHAADPLASLHERLSPYQTIRADFQQTKEIAGMSKPLRSSGQVTVSRQHGVLWQMNAPIKIGYLLAEDRVVEIAADGSRRTRKAQDLPGLAQVARIFRALLGGQTETLNEYFEARGEVKGERWQVTLKPRQAQLAQFLNRIELVGGDYVENISIEEASGDRTRIEFRNSVGAAALKADDLKAYGLAQ
jgi:outer membrane lipoprotein-sorting protein